MAAEDLAQSPLGRIASDGRAHRSSRGNHGNPHDGRRRLPGILSPPPPQRECTAVNAAALRAQTAEVVLTAQMLLGTKTHGEKAEGLKAEGGRAEGRKAY
jgi:hypothetical protein